MVHRGQSNECSYRRPSQRSIIRPYSLQSSICIFFGIYIFCCPLSTAENDLVFSVNSNKVNSTNNNGRTGGKRDIIAMLMRNTEKAVYAIKKQLNMIDNYLRDDFSAELVVMHDGYFHSKQLVDIRQSTRRIVEFVNVDIIMLRMPKNEYEGVDPYNTDPNWSKNAKWSYHQMIRFWLYDVFRLSTMQDVGYFLRMDDDSVFQAPVENLFNLMREKKAVYISNTRRKEWPGLTGLNDLKRFTTEYVKTNNIKPKNPKEWSEAFPAGTVFTFDNNFELGNMDFFRRPDVSNWTRAVLKSGGVFKYRWGDAPLRFLTMAIFANDEEVLHRRDLHIEYCHPRCSPGCPCDKDGKPEDKVEIRERAPGYETNTATDSSSGSSSHNNNKKDRQSLGQLGQQQQHRSSSSSSNAGHAISHAVHSTKRAAGATTAMQSPGSQIKDKLIAASSTALSSSTSTVAVIGHEQSSATTEAEKQLQ